MKIFLDSADVEEIENAVSLGIVEGITTNPSLISKTNSDDFFKIVKEICIASQKKPVSIEVSAEDYRNMILQGEKIFTISSNIVLKLPVTEDGIKACKYFSSQGKDVNMTLCFTASQALIAARAGAKYVSPFIGRIEDINSDGFFVLQEIKSIFENFNDISTKILAASIRNNYHFIQAASIGCDYATIPYSLLKKLIYHPLTEKGLEIFKNDWSKSGLKI